MFEKLAFWDTYVGFMGYMGDTCDTWNTWHTLAHRDRLRNVFEQVSVWELDFWEDFGLERLLGGSSTDVPTSTTQGGEPSLTYDWSLPHALP